MKSTQAELFEVKEGAVALEKNLGVKKQELALLEKWLKVGGGRKRGREGEREGGR